MKNDSRNKISKRSRMHKKYEYLKKVEEMRRAEDDFINKCLSNNDPPELRAALDRMLAQGETEDFARRRISTCFFLVRGEELVTKTPFDVERFLRLLNALPYIDPKEGITGFDWETGEFSPGYPVK